MKKKLGKMLSLSFGVTGVCVMTSLLTSFHTPQIKPTSDFKVKEYTYTTFDGNDGTDENKQEIERVTVDISNLQEETPKSAAPVRYAITDEERYEIERIVASEGGYCPYLFQSLVAECILNGCESDNIRPLELFERGYFWLTNNVEPTETTKRAVSDVFDKGIVPTEEPVRYYYNPSFCESPEHETFCFVLENCGCRFFKDWR